MDVGGAARWNWARPAAETAREEVGGGELWLTSDPFAAEEGSRAAPASSDGGRAVAERPSRHEIRQSPKQGWAMSGGGSSSVP
jgi:hypothetical protein